MTLRRFFSLVRLIFFTGIIFFIIWIMTDNAEKDFYCLNFLHETIFVNCDEHYPKLRSLATVLLLINSAVSFVIVGIWLFIVSRFEISRPDQVKRLWVWWWVLLVIGTAFISISAYFVSSALELIIPYNLVKVSIILSLIFLISSFLISVFTLPRVERGATPGGNLVGGWLALW